MKPIVIIFSAIVVLAYGCFSDLNKILSITTFRQAQPFNGPVEIRLPDDKPKLPVLFEMRIIKNEFGGLPHGEFLEELKQEGSRHGANTMVFQCGAPGTTGQTVCIIHGYRTSIQRQDKDEDY